MATEKVNMGAFALPRGVFELNLKPKQGKPGRYNGWTNVMMTDGLRAGDIADCVEMWSENYEVLGARYNGRNVDIPMNYHWELRYKDETLGCFYTREEAKAEMVAQKNRRRKDKTVKVGLPVFVQD